MDLDIEKVLKLFADYGHMPHHYYLNAGLVYFDSEAKWFNCASDAELSVQVFCSDLNRELSTFYDGMKAAFSLQAA